MAEGISTFNYKGKTIICVDYSGFASDKTTQKEKTIKLRKSVTEEYSKYPPKSVLGIVNFNNFYFDMDVLNVFKEELVKCDPYEKKAAVIGVKSLLKAAYNFVVGFTKPNYKVFDTEEEAKEWLVSD